MRMDPGEARPRAVVVGAGLGGLASAMRLGAKGYAVTVLDRLETPGGRGSALHRGGHRFDLGPTIVTVPDLLRDLWAATGRDFDADIDLRALDPFYEIRWPDGSTFTMRPGAEAMREEVRRLAPGDLKGFDRFLKDAEARYEVGFVGLGRRPMHRIGDMLKVLPTFARLRADRSLAAHAAARVRDPRLRMALSFHPLFIGGDPFRVTSMYALVSHLEATFGVHYAIGGVARIAERMAAIVREQGGQVRQNAEVDRIEIVDGRARGVTLITGERVPAEVTVSNADPGHTYDRLLRDAPRRRWTTRRLARRRWSMGVFVWYFGTRGTRGMWKGVGHHTILNGPRYEGLVRDIFRRGTLSEDFALYVHRPSVTDPTVAPEGTTRSTPSPACPISATPTPSTGTRCARPTAPASSRRWSAPCRASARASPRRRSWPRPTSATATSRPWAAASRSSRASCNRPGSGRTTSPRRRRGSTSSGRAPIPAPACPA